MFDVPSTFNTSRARRLMRAMRALNLVQLLSFGAVGSEEVVDSHLAVTNTFGEELDTKNANSACFMAMEWIHFSLFIYRICMCILCSTYISYI